MKILVNIDVPELAPAIEFYCSALGLSLSRTLDEDVAELAGGSSVIYLLQNAEGSSPGRNLAVPRRYSGHWTPVHIDFAVDDIETAAQRVAAAGGIRESECVEWNGSKCITLRSFRTRLLSDRTCRRNLPGGLRTPGDAFGVGPRQLLVFKPFPQISAPNPAFLLCSFQPEIAIKRGRTGQGS